MTAALVEAPAGWRPGLTGFPWEIPPDPAFPDIPPPPLVPEGKPRGAEVFGWQRPVIFTCPPWVTSAGWEAIELAASTGLFLDPWESWFLIHALGEDEDGKWSSFAVKITISRQNGKGAILEARELAGLFSFGEELMIHSAHRFNTCEIAFKRMLTRIEANPDLDRQVARTPMAHGEQGIELFPTPTIITGPGGRQVTVSRTPVLRFLARSTSAARGFTGDYVAYDEDMILDADAVAASLPTMSARTDITEGGPQVWYAGSAGMGKLSTQASRVRRRGLAAAAGRVDPGDDAESLCMAEWSITPHDEYCRQDCDDPGHDDTRSVATLAKANAGLGLRLTVRHSRRELREMGPEKWARERLGVGEYPAPEDGWAVISERRWDTQKAPDTARPTGLVGAVDMPRSRQTAAIGLCGRRPDDGRRQVELAKYDRGTKWVVPTCARIDREFGPGLVWVIDPRGGAGSLITPMEDAGLRVERTSAQQVAHAFGLFYDALRDDELVHADEPEVRRAVAGGEARKLSDGLAWDKTNDTVDICPVCALTLAHWGHVTFGGQADYSIAESVGFDVREVIRLIGLGVYSQQDVERLWMMGILTDSDLGAIAQVAGVQVRAGLSRP